MQCLLRLTCWESVREFFSIKKPAPSEKSPPYPLLSKSHIPPMIGCLCCNKYCCRWCLLFCVCIWPTFGRLSLKAWREPAQCLRWGLTCWESVRESFSIKKIPSEMEVAPRYNCLHCWHCWHCWHWWHYLHCLHYKHCLHCWHGLSCWHGFHCWHGKHC